MWAKDNFALPSFIFFEKVYSLHSLGDFMSVILDYQITTPQPAHDSACSHLAGMEIQGVKAIWRVVERIDRKKNSSGGNFSVGYLVENKNGIRAFMKATDTALTTGEGSSALVALEQAIAIHKFERQILDFCRGNNMDRIVHALDYGEVRIRHNDAMEWVFFIIFELAQGDVRSAAFSKGYDFVWTVHALHNLCVAVVRRQDILDTRA